MSGNGADSGHEADRQAGFSRYRDPVTRQLGYAASAFETSHRAWQAANSRFEDVSPYLVADLGRAMEEDVRVFASRREAMSRKLKQLLKTHPVWPFLEPLKGLRGATTARLLAWIGDPLRFPGRVCSEGHHWPCDFDGDTCSMPVYDEQGNESICEAPVGPLRRGTGVRSVWHLFGLFPDACGRLVRKRRGASCSWIPEAQGVVIGSPKSMALMDQIVAYQVEPYVTRYEEAKERKSREHGVGKQPESEPRPGPDVPGYNASGAGEADESGNAVGAAGGSSGGGAEERHEGEPADGPTLPPWRIDRIAKIVAVKAFIGDLFMEWKRIALEDLP